MTTIASAAAKLRAAVDSYDEGQPATNRAGKLLPGTAAELQAVDPVIEAARELLDHLAERGYVEPLS